MKKGKNLKSKKSGKKITRKKAIKKAGWAALTASTILFLKTKAYADVSAPTTANNPHRNPRSTR